MNRIVVYEEIDKDIVDKHIVSLQGFVVKSYKVFPVADPMIHFLLDLEHKYDHSFVLIGRGSRSRDWISKEIRSGNSNSQYKKDHTGFYLVFRSPRVVARHDPAYLSREFIRRGTLRDSDV